MYIFRVYDNYREIRFEMEDDTKNSCVAVRVSREDLSDSNNSVLAIDADMLANMIKSMKDSLQT